MSRSPDTIRSITHDIRNLLTAVRGHAELALRRLSPEDPAREDVAHVVVVASAVFDLVDQLDGSDPAGSYVAVNLDRTVGSMRRLLDALLPPFIEMYLAPASDEAYVTIPKLRVERIVLNLALNARDAMEEGGTLSVTTRRTTNGEVQVIVSDTGPGFTEEALEHLFEEGFTTKGERGGTGSGLFSVKRFVDTAGGRVVVDSRAGEGSTVTVTLPSVEATSMEAASMAPAGPGDALDGARDGGGEPGA